MNTLKPLTMMSVAAAGLTLSSCKKSVNTVEEAMSSVIMSIVEGDDSSLSIEAAKRGIHFISTKGAIRQEHGDLVGLDFSPYGDLDTVKIKGEIFELLGSEESDRLQRVYDANQKGLARTEYPDVFGIYPVSKDKKNKLPKGITPLSN